MSPSGSRPGTGARKDISTPRSPLVANVRPRSVIARRAGPAVFQNAYGPVTATLLTFASGVDTRHGPKRAASVRSLTSTHAVAGPTPNTRASKRYAGANAKRKRLVSLKPGMLRQGSSAASCPPCTRAADDSQSRHRLGGAIGAGVEGGSGSRLDG